jgi:hypothetical protein
MQGLLRPISNNRRKVSVEFIAYATASFETGDPLHAPDISPLFKADAVNIAVSASKDGKLRVVYAGWDDAKAVLPGEVLELRWGSQGVEARILPRRQGKR